MTLTEHTEIQCQFLFIQINKAAYGFYTPIADVSVYHQSIYMNNWKFIPKYWDFHHWRWHSTQKSNIDFFYADKHGYLWVLYFHVRSHFMFLISVHNHFLYLSLTGGWQASLLVPIREEYEYLWVRMQAQQFENKSDTSNFLKVTKDSSAVSRVRGEEKKY